MYLIWNREYQKGTRNVMGMVYYKKNKSPNWTTFSLLKRECNLSK